MKINNIWQLDTTTETMELTVNWRMTGRENEILTFVLNKYANNIDESDIDADDDEEAQQIIAGVKQLLNGIALNLRTLSASRNAMEALGFTNLDTVNKH